MRAQVLFVIVLASGAGLFAQAAAGAGGRASGGPCQSVTRCQRLEAIGLAGSPRALRRELAGGCDGYPEQAVGALRGYQLKLPGAERRLIGTMPRGLGDISSLLFLTAAPTSESATDFQVFLQAGGPQDQIPASGCGDFDAFPTRPFFAAYFGALADVLPSYPRFIPRFLEITQLFGHLDDARILAPGRGYSPVDPVAVLDNLLRILYKRDPAAVSHAALFTVFGDPALKVAQSAAPQEQRND